MIYDNLDVAKVNKIKLHVENNSDQINGIVDQIIHPYVQDLDGYVNYIRACLKDGENPPTNEELEDFCLNLSTFIYFASGMCEQLGIRDDISRAVWKEMYHSKRNGIEGGTIADKDSQAELASQQEQIVNICYNRAYKIVKAKVENSQELLSSCKKVLSHRMQEMELTHIGGK